MLNILASVPIITYCVGSLKIFYDSFNNDSSELKPVMAITVDGGGSDESKIDKNYGMCD